MLKTLNLPLITTMDDDFDIYGDLDGFESEAKKESKIIKELKTEIEDLKAKIAEKEVEKQFISCKNEILLENISSLLLTAKSELKRKDLLIADVRRQMDNTAFRRNSTNVRKHDRYTQTTLIRMLSQEVQTDSVGTMTEPGLKKGALERRTERSPLKKVRGDRGKPLEGKKSAKLVDLRDRLREKMSKEKTTADSSSEKRRDGIHRWDKSRERDRDRERERERERERDRRARHRVTARSPKVSPVRFSHPLRVSRQEHDKTDSDAEAKLTKTFIPMNRKELDQYVKEIARKENRSPDECCPGSGRKKKDMLDASNSELWDAGPLEKKKEPCAVKVEETIIQSDEIGTTLSPGSMEDVEQKMRILHGEPTTPECARIATKLIESLTKTPQPPALVIPPLEPPIITQVPEVPFEDDLRLNDSRELRIVESRETLAEQIVGETEELEDGEIASSDGDSVKEDNDQDRSSRAVRTESKRKEATNKKTKREERILHDKLEEPVARKNTRSDRKKERTESKRKEATTKKSKREARILLDKLEDCDVWKHYIRKDQKTDRSQKDVKGKSKMNQSATFNTSTPIRTSRRNSERETSTVGKKAKTKARLSEPVKQNEISAEEPHGKLKKETLKVLFGSDDENSLCEPPIAGKRKLSVGREESKYSKKQRIRSKEKDSKDAGNAELKMTTCEVVRIQSITPPTDVLDDQPILKETIPEEVPANTAHQEEPPREETSVKSFKLDQPLGEASPEEAPETKEVSANTLQQHEPPRDDSLERVLMETRHQDRPPTEVSDQNDKLPIDASMEEIPVNRTEQDHPSPVASSGEVLMEALQQDQPTQEVTVNTSQNDQLPTDKSLEKTSSSNAFLQEQPSVEIPPQEDLLAACHHDASIEEIPAHSPQEHQPPPDVSSEVVIMETEQQDQPTHTSHDDQLPMDASLEKTSPLNAFLPIEPSVVIPPQEDLLATCHHDASIEEIPANSPQEHQPPKDVPSEEVLLETQQQDQPTHTSQHDQLPMDASLEETSPSNAVLPQQPLVDIPPQKDPLATCLRAAPEEHHPPTDASSEEVLMETQQQDQPPTESNTSQNELLLPMDAPQAKTPAKASQKTNQLRSPEVVIFSNKYGEYRVEDNSETETTIYVTRKKKKKSKSSRANVSTG